MPPCVHVGECVCVCRCVLHQLFKTDNTDSRLFQIIQEPKSIPLSSCVFQRRWNFLWWTEYESFCHTLNSVRWNCWVQPWPASPCVYHRVSDQFLHVSFSPEVGLLISTVLPKTSGGRGSHQFCFLVSLPVYLSPNLPFPLLLSLVHAVCIYNLVPLNFS